MFSLGDRRFSWPVHLARERGRGLVFRPGNGACKLLVQVQIDEQPSITVAAK
jgi:hypothetical protein